MTAPLAPKKTRLPYIIAAIMFVGYFIVIVTSPITFDWKSFGLFMAFLVVIVGIGSGKLRPPGFRKRERERLEAERRRTGR